MEEVNESQLIPGEKYYIENVNFKEMSIRQKQLAKRYGKDFKPDTLKYIGNYKERADNGPVFTNVTDQFGNPLYDERAFFMPHWKFFKAFNKGLLEIPKIIDKYNIGKPEGALISRFTNNLSVEEAGNLMSGHYKKSSDEKVGIGGKNKSKKSRRKHRRYRRNKKKTARKHY